MSVRIRLDLAYVIQGDDATGVVKVGRSARPEQRVASLVSNVPFRSRLVAVLLDGAARERAMKTLLGEFKVHGEWFLPSQELQDYLAAARQANAIVRKHEIDALYVTQHVIPEIHAHLGEREPLMNPSGDLVYRVLREGVSAVTGRMDDLMIATAGRITPEVAAGYLPLLISDPTPTIRMPSGAEAGSAVRVPAPILTAAE